MAFALNDILEFRVPVYMAPQTAINVFHGKVTAVTGSGAPEGDVALAVNVDLGMKYVPLMTNTATYRGVGVRRLDPGPPGTEFISTSLTGAGVAGTTPMPKQICGLIYKRGNLPGRAGKGRLYIPFPDEVANEGDATPSAVYLAFAATLANYFLTPRVVPNVLLPLNNLTITWGVWSRTLVQFGAMQVMGVRDAWATQRRRGDFGASNPPPF